MIIPKKHKLSRFHGGLKLVGHKDVSMRSPIRTQALPSLLRVPLQQHIGANNEPVVSVGDYVLKGQLIGFSNEPFSAAVHAPSSGTVTAIDKHEIPNSSATSSCCIDIRTDGKDEWIELNPVGLCFRQYSREQLLETLCNSGIVGLGGAAFPSTFKLSKGYKSKVSTLIINAAECEPWITCDQSLMQGRSKQVIQGVEVCLYLSGAAQCVIAIEDNKPAAIAALKRALANQTKIKSVEIVVIPSVYPTGGERQLIKVITGLEVPVGGLPSCIGLVVLNVATAYAVGDFIISGKPLIYRIVSVTGSGITSPCNIETLVGSMMNTLIDQAGGECGDVNKVIHGGPMMGTVLPHTDLPIKKSSNCLLLLAEKNENTHRPTKQCTRCGQCSTVCPVKLLPQQIHRYFKTDNFVEMERFNVTSCIECGCCEYVCPSSIPLTKNFRSVKIAMSNIKKAQDENVHVELLWKAMRIKLQKKKQRLSRKKMIHANILKTQNKSKKEDSHGRSVEYEI